MGVTHRRTNISAKAALALGLGVAALALPGCGGLKNAMGMEKSSPDEFEVVRSAPLVMPPDYALRPPRPGEKRPVEYDSQAQAISALFPGRTSLPEPSRAETALLSKAGATGDLSAARSNVNDDKSIVVDKGVFLRELLSTESGMVDPNGTQVSQVSSQPLPPPGEQPKKKK